MLQGSFTSRRTLAVITPVGHAPGDGEAMGYRVEGKFRGGEDIPHHIRPLEVGVQAIALVVRQVQMLTGKGACGLGFYQLVSQFNRALRVGNDRAHLLAGLQ